jgi:hypothetical protein
LGKRIVMAIYGIKYDERFENRGIIFYVPAGTKPT